MHEADKAGDFPAGLEEQFEILAGFGAPDNTEDHFHDDIEFTEQALVQAVMKPFLGPSPFSLFLRHLSHLFWIISPLF